MQSTTTVLNTTLAVPISHHTVHARHPKHIHRCSPGAGRRAGDLRPPKAYFGSRGNLAPGMQPQTWIFFIFLSRLHPGWISMHRRILLQLFGRQRRRSGSLCRSDDGRRRRSASSYFLASKNRAIHEQTGNRARCLKTWSSAPRKRRGSDSSPAPLRLPNSAVIWPVASFRTGFSPWEKARIPEGSPVAKVSLMVHEIHE